jgi:hypothetical protein
MPLAERVAQGSASLRTRPQTMGRGGKKPENVLYEQNKCFNTRSIDIKTDLETEKIVRGLNKEMSGVLLLSRELCKPTGGLR